MHRPAGVAMRQRLAGRAVRVRGLIRTAGRSSGSQRLEDQLHGVLLVAEACGCHEVARWFGERPRTIERWVLAFGRTGSAGPMPHAGHGRRSRLDATVMAGLLRNLSASPAALGYRSWDWNSKLPLQHLRSRYQLGLSLRQCQRTLRRLQSARPQRQAMRREF